MLKKKNCKEVKYRLQYYVKIGLKEIVPQTIKHAHVHIYMRYILHMMMST
jgi:hypothetical protein